MTKMAEIAGGPTERAWAIIEAEKRRDRFLRRVSAVAWTVTFVIAVAFTVLIGLQVAQMWRLAEVGAAHWVAVAGAAIPLVVVLGFLSVLIGTLATVGIFLRHRAASLAEIQLRLAALEEMLARQEAS